MGGFCVFTEINFYVVPVDNLYGLAWGTLSIMYAQYIFCEHCLYREHKESFSNLIIPFD